MKKTAGTNKQMTKLMLVTVAMSLGLTACTKPRDTKIADESLELELMAISELQGSGYQMKLGNDARTMDHNSKPIAVNEKPSFKVQSAKVPSKLSGLISNAPVKGKPGESLALRFKVLPSVVFVMKQVTDVSELSTLDQDLVETVGQTKFLPIYTIPVQKTGILVRQKNDYGEQSYKQDFRATALAQATHVQLDLRAEKFKAVEIPASNPTLRQEIFLANQLNNRVTTVAETEELLQTRLGLSSQSEKVATRLVRRSSPDRAAKVDVLIYTIKKRGEIKDRELLAKLDSRIENSEVLNCPAEIKSQAGDDCVLILERSLVATSVQATLALNEDGQPTGNVKFEEVKAGGRTTLLQLAANSQVTEVGPLAARSLNPLNTIMISDIKGKEFLFRRTFEDAASSLSAFGPGASGNLEIIKFDMEDHRLVVRRADAVNSERQAGDIDKEELMSIPVVYLRLKGDDGTILVSPQQTTKERAEVISLNWTQNTIPTTSSPLAFFQAGQCFAATGNKTITNMDMRLKEGSLNFSISGSYTFIPECMSQFGLNDYWYGGNLQSTFNLSERISFKAHDKSRDQIKNQDLPFRAQALLGFGIFTLGKRVPDQFGNFGRINNELALPVIQDFANGKVLTYTLGGLPEDETYKKIFIDTTRQVIKDWNENMRRAFQGTPLERSGDYIALKIDGIDSTPGRLGDLDRNYIWNFDKGLDSGLLGMSQSAPNPRTGIAEQNNVLMYSGNLLGYIGSTKNNARILREYKKLKAAAAQKIENEFRKELAEATNTGTQAPATSQDKLQDAQRLIRRWSDTANYRSVPRTPRALQTAEGLKAMGQAYKAIQYTGAESRERKAQAAASISITKGYLRQIVEKALAMDAQGLAATRDEAMLQALSAAEVLKAYGNRLSQEERLALSMQTRRLALAAEFQKNFRKGLGCVISAEGIPSMGGVDLADVPTEQMFSNWYAKTLSHEIGHSLGLTHNFKGSFDKSNFKFGDENSDRHYSSIMDYPSPNRNLTNYQKPGPYDAHALRAGYTGLIEVADSVKAAAQDQNGKKVIGMKVDGQVKVIELVAGKFVNLEDMKNAVIPGKMDSTGKMVKSWWDVTSAHLAKLPLKFYHFCTDIHVGGDPTCNRWDAGTTPAEVVKFYIDEYQDQYPLMNARGDRINSVGMGSYIGRVMTNFFAVRQFMDETFFRSIQGYSDVGSYVPAALESYKFFLNTFNTPHTTADVNDPSRFTRVDFNKSVAKVGADGKPIIGVDGQPVTEQQKAIAIIEARATQDITESGTEEIQVRTRGIEFDKALALMMLTTRDLRNPRYEQISLRLSFADFEKYAMQLPAESSFIMRALSQTLADNMTSVLFVDGGLAQVPATLVPQTSEIVRYYAVLGSIVFLEASTLEDKDNFATLFRVGSALESPPTDRLVVTKADQNAASRGALKFFAFDNADMSASLVRNAAQKRVILDNADMMAAAVDKVIMAKTPEEQKTELANAAKVFEGLNRNGVLLNEAEAKAGITFQRQVVFTVQHVQQMIQV
ncbi:MAG: zinc-dependent metalloprotease, partial [Bdellovibrio sp.]